MLLEAIGAMSRMPSNQLGGLSIAASDYVAHKSRRIEVLAKVARDAVVTNQVLGHSEAPEDAGRPPRESVEHVVLSAVLSARAILVAENAAEGQPFRRWTAAMRRVGLDMLELAYRETETGTAFNALEPRALVDDLRGPGRGLWHHLVDCDEGAVDRRFAELLLLVESRAARRLQGTTSIDHGALQSSLSTPATVPMPQERPPSLLVVCPQPIPPSSERQDRDEIERHQVLRAPLPITPMPDRPRLAAMRETLLAEFPWASAAIDVVMGEAIGMNALGVRDLFIPPTLFVGPPGSGKTRMARRLGELLTLPCLDVCVGGAGDHKVLAGTSRGWSGGRPGDVVTFLAQSRTASALVLLDELDKVGTDARFGSLHGYLLSLLEPETASRHHDCFLKTNCDLSRVSWVCTANSVSTLPAALQSPLRVLFVPLPRPEDHGAIARGAIRDLEQRWRLPEAVMPSLHAMSLAPVGATSARQVRAAVEVAVVDWSARQTKH